MCSRGSELTIQTEKAGWKSKIWEKEEKDDEFPAQVKLFARENATDYVHYEEVSFMIADLCERIDAVCDGE